MCFCCAITLSAFISPYVKIWFVCGVHFHYYLCTDIHSAKKKSSDIISFKNAVNTLNPHAADDESADAVW